MTFLHSVVTVPMGWVVAAAIVGVVLLVLWLATLFSRRRYVTIRKSEETEMMIAYLSRIAEALERLAAKPEAPSPPAVKQEETSGLFGYSMFGR